MEYEKFLDAVREFEFVPDRQTADAMVKAVLGILASSLSDPLARVLTDFLPEPLDYEKLRGHQAKPVAITGDLYLNTVTAQFKLRESQARQIILTVLNTAKQWVGSKELNEIIHTLGFEVAP